MSEDTLPSASMISPKEILAMFYRRRFWLIIPTLVCLLLGVAIALMTPSVYKSQATLLIDAPDIPSSIAAPRPDSFANESVAKIRQQIMSRASLTKLIRETGIYAKEREVLPFDDVLEIMRESITVDLVSASGQNRGAGNDTIAFNLSFEYANPRMAHDVTERLVHMFLAEDKRLRTEKAASTAEFLGKRANDIRDDMVELEVKRREVESRFAGALPDQVALSAQSGSALRAEVSRMDAETQGLLQQNSMLAARSEELAAGTRPELESLRQAETRLAELSSVYADTHPDVIAGKANVQRLRQAAQATGRPAGSAAVDSAIAASNARMGTLSARRGELVGAISHMEQMTAMAPQATYELNNLERDYDNLKRQYQDVRDKQMEAEVASNLQAEDKGERLSVVNAASLPNDPIRPKRLQLVAGGLIGGLLLGLGAVVLYELLAGPIHGASGVARAMNVAPLITIPVLNSETENSFGKKVLRFFGLGRTKSHMHNTEMA